MPCVILHHLPLSRLLTRCPLLSQASPDEARQGLMALATSQRVSADVLREYSIYHIDTPAGGQGDMTLFVLRKRRAGRPQTAAERAAVQAAAAGLAQAHAEELGQMLVQFLDAHAHQLADLQQQ